MIERAHQTSRPSGQSPRYGLSSFRGGANRHDRAGDLMEYVRTLGPSPRQALETVVDLGLSDADIGRYFNIPHGNVYRLRQIWKIERAD